MTPPSIPLPRHSRNPNDLPSPLKKPPPSFPRKRESSSGIYEMGIADADPFKNPRYFKFIFKKTTHFANACSNHSSETVGLIWTTAFAEVTGFWFK